MGRSTTEVTTCTRSSSVLALVDLPCSRDGPSTPRWVQALQNSLCKSLKSADCRKRVLDNLSSYLWLILTLSSASVLCNVSATLRARVSLPAVGGALAA